MEQSLQWLLSILLKNPYHLLNKNFGPPARDQYHDLLILDIRRFQHPRQDLRYQMLPVNKRNKNMQKCNVTRNSELYSLTHTTTVRKFEVTVIFVGLDPHPIPTLTQIKH